MYNIYMSNKKKANNIHFMYVHILYTKRIPAAVMGPTTNINPLGYATVIKVNF